MVFTGLSIIGISGVLINPEDLSTPTITAGYIGCTAAVAFNIFYADPNPIKWQSFILFVAIGTASALSGFYWGLIFDYAGW